MYAMKSANTHVILDSRKPSSQCFLPGSALRFEAVSGFALKFKAGSGSELGFHYRVPDPY
jgi:hypothetical protein